MSEFLITQARLKELLSYDPETGVFIWLIENGRRGKVGTVAGSRNGRGYLMVKIDNRGYPAHRLAFLYMAGALPSGDIDHIDLNRANNAWANLREATPSQNNANVAVRRNNHLGIKGVSTSGSRYMARIKVNGKCLYLGTFKTSVEAHAAYMVAAKEHFGEFARAS